MRSKHLISSSLWNLSGGVIPIFLGLFILPLLIDIVGTERFGILTFAWVVVGYFSVFDLGLGRALTKLTAERLVDSDTSSLPGLMWTSLAMMFVMGIVGMLIVYLGGQWFVTTALELSDELTVETLRAFDYLAFVVPFITTSAGFRGFLEAYSRFDLVNIVRIPQGIIMFAGPLFAAYYEPTISAMVLTLVSARIVSWIVLLVFCLMVEPAIRSRPRFIAREVRPLVTFGGWMTVSNIVGPVMLYLDRFLIGAILSVLAVAYYTTPYEVITKFLIVPAALAGVLFPAMVSALNEEGNYAEQLYRTGISASFLLWLPLAFVGVFASELLFIWLGNEFSMNSAVIVKWLAVGVFLNGIAFIPFYFVQAAGRPDIVALIHLIELPFYVAALYYSLVQFGVEGAAIVWALRVALDNIIFLIIATRLHSPLKANLGSTYLGICFGLLGFAVVYLPSWFVWKCLFLLIVSAFMAAYVWARVLTEMDRRSLLHSKFLTKLNHHLSRFCKSN